jgi:hypothetical protein
MTEWVIDPKGWVQGVCQVAGPNLQCVPTCSAPSPPASRPAPAPGGLSTVVMSGRRIAIWVFLMLAATLILSADPKCRG